MGTLDLLKTLKKFLPNNTAYKLFKNDLLYIESGAVATIKFEGFYQVFKGIKENNDLAAEFKLIFDDFIAKIASVIYNNGGVFIKFDFNLIHLLFDQNLLDKTLNEVLLLGIKCVFEIFEEFKQYISGLNEKYDLGLKTSIKAGINAGTFTDLLIGSDKRRERILLGKVIKQAIDLASQAQDFQLLIPKETYPLIENDSEVKGVGEEGQDYFSLNLLKPKEGYVTLPNDDYLNLKTSLIRSFLPDSLFKILKKQDDELVPSYKEGGVIDIELKGLHEYADYFLEKYPQITDELDQKVFVDDFFFKLNKLFKKIIKYAINFDGAINRLDLSSYGVRILITFSLPHTLDNDANNKIICVEELDKLIRDFKKFPYKIVHFDDKMFAGIVGNSERGAYLVFSPLFNFIDEAISKLKDCEVQELKYDLIGASGVEISDEQETEVKVGEVSKISFKGLHTRAVVGRNKEIITFNQLFRDGGKIAVLVGEYGSGKTRLVEEIYYRMENEHFKVLHSKVENRDNIIDLFKYLIEKHAKITFFDTDKEIKAKLKEYFSELIKCSPKEHEREKFKSKLFILYKIMYNLDLEDEKYQKLSPTLRLENLKEALSLYIIFSYYYYAKKNEGVIFIFDDIDNLKHEEKDLLQYVIQYSISHLVEKENRRNDRNKINKISFLITHHISEDLKFNKFLKPVKVELLPLKKDVMKDLLQMLAGGKKIPSEIEKVLLKQAEGNPFYLEQYFRYLYYSDMLKEFDDHFEKTKYYRKRDIPKSIEEIVKTNLLRLSEEDLEFLQACSIIGVKFDLEIVSKYYDNYNEARVNNLLEENYIKRYYEDGVYCFVHPLVGDMLYALADKKNKEKWHAEVALLLDKSQLQSRIANPLWHSHHLKQAQKQVDAKKYMIMAYEDALEKNFLETAYNMINEYLKLFDNEQNADFEIKKVELLYKMGSYTEARKQSLKLAGKLESEKNFQGLNELANIALLNTFNYSPLSKIKEIIQLKSKSIKYLPNSDSQKALLYYFHGKYKEKEGRIESGITYLQKALSLSIEAKDDDIFCMVSNYLGECWEKKYRFKKALAIFEEGLALAQKNDSLTHQSVIYGNLGKINYKLGRIQDAISSYEEALKLASLLSLKEVEAKCAGELGNLYMEIRILDRGVENIERSIRIHRALTNLEEVSYRLSDLGESYILQNNSIEAEKCFNKAYKVAKRVNNTLARAYALINFGRLKSLRRHYQEAEEHFKEAIKIYREKNLYKRMGMAYYYLAKMGYLQIIDLESDPFVKYKKEAARDISGILKYMKHSLKYSALAKNIHFTAKGHLLLAKILKRRNLLKEAYDNILLGKKALIIIDYSKLYVDYALAEAKILVKLNRKKEALTLLNHSLHKASKNNYLNSVELIKNTIQKLKEN